MKRKNLIPYESIGNIMQKSGIERVSQSAKVEMVEHLEIYIEKVSRIASKFANHAGRKTVTDKDIKLALEQLGE